MLHHHLELGRGLAKGLECLPDIFQWEETGVGNPVYPSPHPISFVHVAGVAHLSDSYLLPVFI